MSGTPAADGLRIVRDGDLVRVTLCASERRNAQTPAMWRAMASLGAEIDASVSAVLITGEGPSFSAGLDRRLLSQEGLPGEAPITETVLGDDLPAWIKQVQAGFRIWREIDAVVVAVVRGQAIGAGFQLALAADIIVAGEDARFSMREVTLGLVPDLGGTGALARALGYHRAFEICTSGRPIDAVEAQALGLVAAVVPPDAVEDAALEMIRSLTGHPFAAVRAIKRALRDAHLNSTAEHFRVERSEQVAQLRAIVSALHGGA